MRLATTIEPEEVAGIGERGGERGMKVTETVSGSDIATVTVMVEG